MIGSVLSRRHVIFTFTRQTGRAGFAFLARALQQISTLVMAVMAARVLLPGDYGIYSLGIVFIVLIQTLTYTGFYQFILTSKHRDDILLSTCFWLILGFVTFASLLLALAALPLQWLFRAKDLGMVLLLLAAMQPLASIGAWSSAALLRRGAAMLNFQIMFAQNLLALGGGVALIMTWHSLYALVAFRGIRVLSGAILYALFARDYPRLRYSSALARKASRFSAGLYGSRFLGFLTQYSSDLLLGLFHTPTEVGLYRFGNRTATGITDAAVQPMSNFAAMQFGAAARKETDLGLVLERFSGTIGLLTGMLGAAIIVLAGPLVHRVFQPSYAAGLTVTYAMALRSLASSGKLLIEPAFAALGRTSYVMLFNFITSVVAVSAVLLTSPWGLEVLAWSQVGVMFASTGLAFHLLHRHGRVRVGPSLRKFLLAMVLSLAFGLLLELLCGEVLPLMGRNLENSLLAQLALAGLLSLSTLALALRLRVLDLNVFSG